jgi:tetratricopeptide (TPR) repeat protein
MIQNDRVSCSAGPCRRPVFPGIFTVLFFLFTALSGLSADPVNPRETAGELEKKGDRPGAVSAYEEWLRANPASSEFTLVLFHAADIHPDMKSAIGLLEKYAGLPQARQVQSEILGKTATLYEITGDLVKAQTLFEQAYYAYPDEATFPFLFRSARLLFELGEFQKSEDRARVVANLCKNSVTKKRAAFLLTRILAATGSPEDALRVALRLTEDPSNRTDNESIFLFIFSLADGLNREPEKNLALQRLAADYPDSPEFRLARRAGAVKPFPTPSALLNPFTAPVSRQEAVPQTPSAPPAVTPEAAPPPAVTGVQTGSFSVKENADYMMRDLRSMGFAAEIREAAGRTGAPVYKVVIPINRSQSNSEETQRLLIRLKDKGIEGFLLF